MEERKLRIRGREHARGEEKKEKSSETERREDEQSTRASIQKRNMHSILYIAFYILFYSIYLFSCVCVCVYIYIYTYIQCPPLILAPLINMSKGGCENKSALFILLIFHSINSQNSNLSLK